ncbi:MAG: endo-1,4-beta-xylanase [Janthinobacterium lividum]
MKKHLQKAGLAMLAITAMLSYSCKKNAEFNSLNTGNYIDTVGALKTLTASAFPNMGLAVTYTPMSTIPAYLATVKREANIVTFGNELKEGSVVGSTGVYNYTTADALNTLCTTNGLNVYGHTLVWHNQQNVTYLTSLIAPVTTAPTTTNIITNGTFEAGPDATTGDLFTGWQDLNHSVGAFAVATSSAAYAGNRSLQANVTTAGQAYNMQIITRTPIAVTKGNIYNVSFWIKGSVPTTMQFEIRSSDGTVNYQGGKAVTTGWTQITYAYTATGTTMQLAFDLGANAATYYIDEASIIGASSTTTALTAAQQTAAITTEMTRYITTTVQRYPNIKAWDVVNEPLLDNGTVRYGSNYTPTSVQFEYGTYLGTKYNNSYITTAFKAARAAAPGNVLFINEYNLEYANIKTDSLVAMVTTLNKYGATIDGIATQMHITLGQNLNNIDYMFKKLAATGLKIRISELDVTINGAKANPFTPTATLLGYQAAMYKYVINSFLTNVPAAQRFGVTVWGVYDPESYLNTVTSPDAPLMFDAKFAKKPAYAGFKAGLTPGSVH